jgi:carboxyl-terminal processing protease
MRALRTALAALCVIVVGAPPIALARQDWHAEAVASFDAAWQTINDTFYDPTFGGLDWSAVRDQLRPRVEAAISPDAAREVIREMLARLKRSHFALLSASPASALPGPAIVPVDVRVASEGVVVTCVRDGSTAARAGVRPGDVVLAVDDQEASAWDAAAQGTTDASARDLQVWREAYRALHGPEGSVALLRLRQPDGRQTTVRVARAAEPGQTVTLGNLPPLKVAFDAHDVATPRGRRVGVIRFNFWMTTLDAPIADAVDRFRHDDGLVFDLRGNLGGLAGMMSGVAGHLCDRPDLLGTMHTRQATLEFRANPRRSTADGRRVEPFAGPVAVLVDGLTASTSECFTGALQSLGRVRVFGQPTLGEALPALTRKLPNGDVLMYVVGDFVTSTGRRLEGQGVVPDQIEPLSIAALAAGRDLPLDAALQWIEGRGQR